MLALVPVQKKIWNLSNKKCMQRCVIQTYRARRNWRALYVWI